MALFGRQDPKPDAAGERGEFPLPPRRAWCGACSKEQALTKVWRRNGMMRRCPCCNKNRTASTQFIASSPLCGNCRRPR